MAKRRMRRSPPTPVATAVVPSSQAQEILTVNVLPVDVIREVLLHLHPNDLPTLAAVNRYLRHAVPICIDHGLAEHHLPVLEQGRGFVHDYLRNLHLDHPLLFQHLVAAISGGTFFPSFHRPWKRSMTDGKNEELRLRRVAAMRTAVQEGWPSSEGYLLEEDLHVHVHRALQAAFDLRSLDLVADLRRCFPEELEDVGTYPLRDFIYECARVGFVDALALIPTNNPILSKIDYHDCDWDARRLERKTIMSLAAECGSLESVKLLHSLGAPVNCSDNTAKSPLYSALHPKSNRNFEIVRFLLEHGADTEARRKEDAALLIAVSESYVLNHAQCLKLLLAFGANVEARDGIGWTALHREVSLGHPECVQMLLDAGADVNVSDSSWLPGKTPLDVCCDDATKRILETHKASVKPRTPLPLPPVHTAVECNSSGLYTVQRLLRNPNVAVDVVDKLPVPFGLIRYGIAPDHPDAKNVIHKFEKTLEDPRVRFFGNVEIGRDVQIAELFHHYHDVVLSYGASEDKKLGIPGEDARGVVGAKQLVDWYNGMFGCEACPVDLDTESAVVVGQGNVALDVARVLLAPIEWHRKTEMPMPVIEALARSRVKKVHLVGRRGPEHISMTAKELREMLNLKSLRCQADWDLMKSAQEIFNDSSQAVDRSKKRVLELLVNHQKFEPGHDPDGKVWQLDFHLTPSAFSSVDGKLKAAVFRGSKQKEQQVTLDCGIAVRSIGYKSVPIPGIPFDSNRNVVPNQAGRVLDTEAQRVPNLYVSGWLKRGPVGVVAATMYDAFETADALLADIGTGAPERKLDGAEGLEKELKKRNVRTYSLKDWKVIDEHEKRVGEKLGKVREKITSLEELEKVVDGS
ncbi:hypothetical protein HDU96_004504 [Phlyctochytrium bullatum]|nr:hypothetical protein HDU96_004504 [Phlyctochytrium bullatum]